MSRHINEKAIYSSLHCVKNIRIRSYSSPHFPAFGLNTEEQNNSEYEHFLRSVELNKHKRSFFPERQAKTRIHYLF